MSNPPPTSGSTDPLSASTGFLALAAGVVAIGASAMFTYTYVLAREVAKRIENELEYPGQIKVNVIRETRCTEFAK